MSSFFLRTTAAEFVFMVSLTLAGVMDSVFPPLLEGTSSSLASCSHIEGLLLVEHSWKNDKTIDEFVIKCKLGQPDFRKHVLWSAVASLLSYRSWLLLSSRVVCAFSGFL